MKVDLVKFYRCPATGTKLELKAAEKRGEKIIEGELVNSNDLVYPVSNGIPDFTWPKELKEVDQETRKKYDYLAKNYDKFASIPFQTFKCDEDEVREKMIDRLYIEPADKVLEIGCGDGRGSLHILERLSEKGDLFLQELSPVFLEKAIENIKTQNQFEAKTHFSIANASYLSFQENSFNAAHHFGGINTFAEIEKALSELARVVKPGGKVVIGDESMGPWLRDTDMGKIMMNSNPLLKCEVPLDKLPPTAGDVEVEWIMMGAYYVLEFTVLEEEPEADYFVPIPSKRGGNHWKRYYGQLEGVSDEIKQMAYKEIERTGESMTEWLERIIKKNLKS